MFFYHYDLGVKDTWSFGLQQLEVCTAHDIEHRISYTSEHLQNGYAGQAFHGEVS